MAKLIYSAITSFDGYVEDALGTFDWAMPDEQVWRCVNDLERPIGTYLYGRRMYETMVYWESAVGPDLSPLEREFAETWRAADKIVFSTSLKAVSSERTRIEREFHPNGIRELKTNAGRDITVAGANLAAQALAAGLVDECQFFLTPIVVGGGKSSLPDDVRVQLELLNEHRFGNGVVYLHYRSTLA